MKLGSLRSLFPIACVCLLGALSFCARAEADKPADKPAPAPAAAPAAAAAPALATIELQIEYLEGALGEALGSLDWKMAQLAVEGYKNSGLSGDALETSLLRAERCALIEHSGGGSVGPQVLALGMTVRAQLGDAKALPALKSWANDDIPVVKQPDPAMFKDQAVEAVKQEKAYQTYSRAVSRKSYAILGLALLKEPGIGERALVVLNDPATQTAGRGGPGQFMQMFGGRGARVRGAGGPDEPLILAALASDPQNGLKKLLDYAADDKTSLQLSATVLNTLARIAPGSKARQGADEPFSLESDIGAQLPQDIFAQLAKPLVADLKRWKPDDNQNQNPMANMRSFGALMSLLAVANDFPPKSLPPEGIAALQELKDKVPGQQGRGGGMAGQIDAILKKQGVDTTAPQKPPAPPKDF